MDTPALQRSWRYFRIEGRYLPGISYHVPKLRCIRYQPMKIFFRKLHRWLGLLLVLPLASWMISGFYFSFVPITEIRGEHLTAPPESLSKQLLAQAPPPASALVAIDRHLGRDWKFESLSPVSFDGKASWRIEGFTNKVPFVRLVDFESGQVREPLSAEEAKKQAQKMLLEPGDDPSVEWLEEEPANLEFRGRTLPVWRVTFTEPENLHLYLDPWTGELLARRTDRWRIFDFLWMLHILDFDTRDNFNHPLLQIVASMGLVVVLGGFVLWALTTPLFRRRQRRAK